MKKNQKAQVSDNDPKLVLETGDQNAVAITEANPAETATVVETQTGDQNAVAITEANPAETATVVETQTGDQNAVAITEANPAETATVVETQTGDQNAVAITEANPAETATVVETQTGDQNAVVADNEAENVKVWIRAILPLAGRFFMSHDPGHEFKFDKNQAEVIVEAGYAEYLTAEEIALK